MKRIPISQAKDIATKYGYDQVLIFGRKIGDASAPGGEHVATYGVNKVHCEAVARIGTHMIEGVVKPLERKDAEIARLTALLNSPQVKDFLAAVEVEVAHQKERWGDAHDTSKDVGDWALLFQYIIGKQAKAVYEGDWKKYLHHLISLAAICYSAHTAFAPEVLAREEAETVKVVEPKKPKTPKKKG